jgi:hypothetical protein
MVSVFGVVIMALDVPSLRAIHVGTDLAEHCVNFGIGTGEFVGKEVTLGVTNELDQGHNHTPWVRTVAENSFEEDLGHNFFERFLLDRCK